VEEHSDERAQLEVLSGRRLRSGEPDHRRGHRAPRRARSEALGGHRVTVEAPGFRCPHARAPRHRRGRPCSSPRSGARSGVDLQRARGSRRALRQRGRVGARVDRHQQRGRQAPRGLGQAAPQRSREGGRQDDRPVGHPRHGRDLRQDPVQRRRGRPARIGGGGRRDRQGDPRRHRVLRRRQGRERARRGDPGEGRQALRRGDGLRRVVAVEQGRCGGLPARRGHLGGVAGLRRGAPENERLLHALLPGGDGRARRGDAQPGRGRPRGALGHRPLGGQRGPRRAPDRARRGGAPAAPAKESTRRWPAR